MICTTTVSVAGAFVLLEMIDMISGPRTIPGWILTVFIFVIAIGFPMVILFSWFFYFSPDGIKRYKKNEPKDNLDSDFYLLGKRICFETGFSYAHCIDKPDFHAIGIRAGLRWRSMEGILVRIAATPTVANNGIETFFFRTYGISMGYSF